jgi:Flp pilus assembly protein TadG
MIRRLRKLHVDKRGAAMIEFTLVFPLLLLLTFGLVDFGLAFWQFNSVEKATGAGARFLATHGASYADGTYGLVAGIPECFAADDSSYAAGTPCSQVSGATLQYTCGAGGASACDSATMQQLVTTMQGYAPFITAANVSVRLSASGAGFVGRGASVPLISVSTTGLTYTLPVLTELFGIRPLTMPSFTSSITGEDMNSARPS